MRTTLSKFVEQALRAAVAGQAPCKDRFTFAWKPVPGRTLPGIDLADRDSLHEATKHSG